jgi:hypothetical protein
VQTVNNGDNCVTRTCQHRHGMRVFFIVNDPGSAPVICIEHLGVITIISLTNQIVRASCAPCFNDIRSKVV